MTSRPVQPLTAALPLHEDRGRI